MNFNYLKNSKNFSKISFIKISFSLLFIISVSGKINAANDNYPLGSRAAAMSNISVMLSDVWSVFHNQAGLAGLEHIVIGFHHENKFIVPQYGLQALAIGIPVRPGTIGVT